VSFDLRHPADDQERALAGLLVVPAVADELGLLFARAGHELHLVGGSVRDLVLGATSPDLDFTTDAHPEQVLSITERWAQGVWDLGIAFGTVGLVKDGQRLEVTTFRDEVYRDSSRNPTVSYGTSLTEDLQRRDFSVNSMAVSVPDHVFTDPYGGLVDLAAGVLRTPGTAESSFTDDPLRMMRAVRFAAQLGFAVHPDVRRAMTQLADRLDIVSPERVRDELIRTVLTPDPLPGLELFVDTGLADHVLPELSRMQKDNDPLHRHKDVWTHSLAVLRNTIDNEHRLPAGGPDLTVRLAALLHDIGKPDTKRIEEAGGVSFHHHEVVGAKLTRRRMLALKFPKDLSKEVEQLVRLHLRFHGYGSNDSPWTDSAVRRYVTDAGPLLEQLHVLVRSDVTTRNERKANRLARAYDSLEQRIADLRAREAVDAIRPDLDGADVMAVLGVGPSRTVGEALAFLLELRLEHGPLQRWAACEQLCAWAAQRGLACDPAALPLS
jgi:poly(A) polymerase